MTSMSHSGNSPLMVRMMNAVPNKSLSAIGSKTDPNREVQPNRRARAPSSESESAAIPRTMRLSNQASCQRHIDAGTTSKSRSTVKRFGKNPITVFPANVGEEVHPTTPSCSAQPLSECHVRTEFGAIAERKQYSPHGDLTHLHAP